MRAAYSSSTVAYSIWRPVLIPSGGAWLRSDFGAIHFPRMRLKPRRLAMPLAASHMTVNQASSAVEHDAVATVLIIGASRGIGLEAVKAALEAGHSVRALARSARRIRVDHPQLEKMAGDALEMATVKRALTGIDVVIQSLGVLVGPEII